MHEDHQNIFMFVFSFFYLRGCGQFNDFEWKIFSDGEIASIEDHGYFENNDTLLKLKNLKNAISLISMDPFDYILPLIPYNRKFFQI